MSSTIVIGVVIIIASLLLVCFGVFLARTLSKKVWAIRVCYHRDDFGTFTTAVLSDNRLAGVQGTGCSEDEAIGNMVRNNPEVFGRMEIDVS